MNGLFDDSVVGDWMDAVARRVEAAVAESAFVAGTYDRLNRMSTAVVTSRSVQVFDQATATVGRWAHDSWLFGPPGEPEVIVIDLQETYTVGPLIAALDRTIVWLASRWKESRPKRLFDETTEVVAATPIRAAAIVGLAAAVVRLAVMLATGETPTGLLLVMVGLALLGTRERRTAAELRTTVVGRAVEALLVPPEPPVDRQGDTPTERDRSDSE